GSRLEDYSWSDGDGPSVDARLAQRVEVIRGPASVLYGSDALGGVVNVIPEELPDANGGPRATHTGFEISGASNNAELEGAARVEGASGGWGWRLFGIGRFASSLHTPAGELDNTGFSALSGEAAVGTRGPRGSTTLRYTRYGGELKLLESEAPATGETGGPQRKLSDDRVQVAGDYPLSEVGLGRVSVLAGGRVDVRRLAADANAALGRSDETRDYTALSGTLGVVYRPAAAVALTANLGRAWRAPTLFELFANGPHLGEARYEIGDPGLKPEAGTNMDVGVRWQGARVARRGAAPRRREPAGGPRLRGRRGRSCHAADPPQPPRHPHRRVHAAQSLGRLRATPARSSLPRRPRGPQRDQCELPQFPES